MWQRISPNALQSEAAAEAVGQHEASPRRAYYRVSGVLPLRLQRIPNDAIEAAIYDLSLPDRLVAPIAAKPEEASALVAQLRRIEEKLDLLLGQAALDAPRPLAGRDRRPLVFSGAGLAVDVDFEFRRGEGFRIELLLPAPESRVVRAIGVAVDDSKKDERTGLRRLALGFRHIEPSDRDALVGYSYDLQRVELRAKHAAPVARS